MVSSRERERQSADVPAGIMYSGEASVLPPPSWKSVIPVISIIALFVDKTRMFREAEKVSRYALCVMRYASNICDHSMRS